MPKHPKSRPDATIGPTTPVPATRGAGRPPRTQELVDLDKIEHFASLGYPWHLLAPVLGLSNATLTSMRQGRNDMVDHEEILAAYQRGAHAKRLAVLDRLDKHGANSFISNIFEAKQAHILGYSDRQEVSHSGTVKIVREESVIHDRDSVIDAEYTDLGGDD